MEQMYSQALNLIDTLAQKQHLKGLSDFEYKLYESLCEAMSMYFGGLKFAFQISAMKTEIECLGEEVKYLAFIDEMEKANIEAEKKEAKEEKKEEPPTKEE